MEDFISGPVPVSLASGPEDVLVQGPAAARLREIFGAGRGEPDAPRYRTIEVLGRGGMGAVYLAADAVLGREVALKVVLDPASQALGERFRREVEITGRMNHPGIVRVYDSGKDREGRPYYTMKRIRGRPWSEVMAGQSLRERLEVFQRVAEAISHAHSRGVLHRDLKPANVLVGEYGEVVVADWGLARTRNAERGARNEKQQEKIGDEGEDVGLTREGAGMGTLGYAPPEQMDGVLEKMGPTADVYALGGVLHEALAGERAFPGRNEAQIVASQVKGKLAPVPSGTPRELVAIAKKALALAVEGRYPTVAAMLEDLERWKTGFPVSAMPEPFLRRAAKFLRRHPVAAAGALALLLAIPLALLGLSVRADLAERAKKDEEAKILREAISPIAEEIDKAESALADAEKALGRTPPDTHDAEVHAGIALALIEGARKLAAERKGYEGELAPYLARADGDTTRALVLDARRLHEIARAPRAEPLAEVRRRGRVYDEVLAAVAAARKAGADDPLLAEIEEGAGAKRSLTIRTDPAGATVEIHELATDSVEPGELVQTVQGDGRTIELPVGGYLLVISHPGREGCRLPVYLMRDDEDEFRNLLVPLLLAGETPDDYVYIPPGPYLFGERCEPRMMDRGFVIARHELTWGEFWEGYGETLPPERRPQGFYSSGKSYQMCDEIRKFHPEDWRSFPVTGVSHDDLALFCEWKSKLPDARFAFSLATTEEWERASRGADGRTYPWGDAWLERHCNSREAHPAGSFSEEAFVKAQDETYRDGQSVFGLHHTMGNVWEWTSSGEKSLRVYRGGSAWDDNLRCRCWFSGAPVSDLRNGNFGGRLVAVARTR